MKSYTRYSSTGKYKIFKKILFFCIISTHTISPCGMQLQTLAVSVLDISSNSGGWTWKTLASSTSKCGRLQPPIPPSYAHVNMLTSLLHICPSVCLVACLSVCWFVYMFQSLCVCVCLSVMTPAVAQRFTTNDLRQGIRMSHNEGLMSHIRQMSPKPQQLKAVLYSNWNTSNWNT